MKIFHFYFLCIILLLLIIIKKINLAKENFTFTNNFTGDKKCLDIAKDNKLKMNDCRNSSSQQWFGESTNSSNHYKLKNNFLKKCVDVVNDGQNNKLFMDNCKNVSGQEWSMTSKNKLQNNFSGRNKCLDIINDDKNDKLIMADCKNVSGQEWIRRR